jgi:hypothetical protein
MSLTADELQRRSIYDELTQLIENITQRIDAIIIDHHATGRDYCEVVIPTIVPYSHTVSMQNAQTYLYSELIRHYTDNGFIPKKIAIKFGKVQNKFCIGWKNGMSAAEEQERIDLIKQHIKN